MTFQDFRVLNVMIAFILLLIPRKNLIQKYDLVYFQKHLSVQKKMKRRNLFQLLSYPL